MGLGLVVTPPSVYRNGEGLASRFYKWLANPHYPFIKMVG